MHPDKIDIATAWAVRLAISMWSHVAPWSIVSEHAAPRAPKSADRIEGAMIACGDMAFNVGSLNRVGKPYVSFSEHVVFALRSRASRTSASGDRIDHNPGRLSFGPQPAMKMPSCISGLGATSASLR